MSHRLEYPRGDEETFCCNGCDSEDDGHVEDIRETLDTGLVDRNDEWGGGNARIAPEEILIIWGNQDPNQCH